MASTPKPVRKAIKKSIKGKTKLESFFISGSKKHDLKLARKNKKMIKAQNP